MEESRLKIWEVLFERALKIMDSAYPGVFRPDTWSFGCGTVLMLKYRHRLSKDIDIFVPDPQYLGYLSPDRNDAAAELAPKFLQQANFLKLYFAEGEIDFVASQSLTKRPTATQSLLGREVSVETPIEILAKKIRYRGAEFTARDIFDFAVVAEYEADALKEIAPLMRERREAILARIKDRDRPLRTTFRELEFLGEPRSYDTCVGKLKESLAAA